MTVATAMPNVLEAIAIKPKAGYCFKCYKWRYCEHQTDERIICNSCVQILKNQNLFSIIVPAPIVPIIPAEKVKRKQNRPPRQPTIIKRSVLPEAEKLLRDSPKGMTINEIMDALNLSLRRTLVVLERLVKQKVITHTNRKRKRIYAHINHAEIIKNYEGVTVGYKKDTIAIKKAIDNTPDIVSATDIKNLLETRKSRNCVLRTLRFLAARGDVLTYFDEEKDTEYFASVVDEMSVQKFQESVNNSFENRLLKCLESGKKNRTEIARLLGKNQRSVKLITKVLDRLKSQKKVRSIKVGNSIFYELKSQ